MDKDTQKSQAALREEAILQYWKENNIFNKSLEKESPESEYVFYEGPPTANGKPGIHHLEARAFKDVIPRYKTMQGYHVRRKGGWDTHGLPVELQVEKKLGLSSKKAIEDYGIAKFNQECKESVWEYLGYWNKFTERIGYWVDQENPYVTYHNDYIESVWNVIKEADKQKLLYKDYKVVPWCPRCGTALSSHELAQGYETVKDLSVTAKFKLTKTSADTFAQVLGRGEKEGPDHSQKYSSEVPTYVLAWTTTPWTLPGNVALAVGENIEYVEITSPQPPSLTKEGGKGGGESFILAKNRLSIIEGEYKILKEFKGKDLVGLEYEPLYPYFKDTIDGEEKKKLDKAFKVYSADFVTTEDGTGVVHTAVMYGQDDFALGNKIGLPKHHLVGLDGKFIDGMDFLSGRFVRDEAVAVDIIKDLAHRGLLFKKEKYEHSYPHCWRCHTALIYYARDSWYIRMTELRDKMVKENEGINWEPSYIKEGRFGEWLRDIKDWAISRERYWGSPLPVWTCEKCKKVEVLGSVDEIKSKTKKSGNKYFMMRHGRSDGNEKGNKVSCNVDNVDHLTEEGKKQVLDSTEELKNKKINLIISSDLIRTKETSEIIKKELNIQDDLIFDERLRELNAGIFDGKTWDEYHDSREEKDWYRYTPPNGESCKDMKLRMFNFLYEMEKKYKDKNILIITHEGPIRITFDGIYGRDDAEIAKQTEGEIPHVTNAQILGIPFVPLPHNENYELDLHKPFIDEVDLVCSCGGKLERTKEVMDVWLDSGTMPFSQDHYPFENKDLIDSGKGYPADFISEAIDQTRGWFYTLHAVGAIMGKGKAYKNVICLGHLLDANGKKMSKSLGNIVDPWIMMDKYGVDTLRLWMYSVNQPGESKNFDEKTVAELHNKVFNLLYNVLAFYELYRDKELESREKVLPLESPRQDLKEANVLDQWIIAKLNALIIDCTESMENYKLLEPVRAIKDFINDLSTWYLRRSRERIKEGDYDAKQTLYFVLKTLAKLMAPFAPFASEDIWQKLKNSRVSMASTRHDSAESDPESVHLAKWPEAEERSDLKNLKRSVLEEAEIIKEMQKVRDIVTLGLQARQKAGIPVRQPLGELRITNYEFGIEYLEIIKDELNIKEIKIKKGDELKVEIDTNITELLKKEGQYRELVRAIQDIRKKNGLNPSDIVTLIVETNTKGQELINKFKDELMKTTSARGIEIKENNGQEIKIDELVFVVSLK